MSFVTQAIPEDKKSFIQSLCDQEGQNYSVRRWTINSDTGDFLICLSWETGRGDPRSPGLWLFVRNEQKIRLRILANEDWGPHIDGVHFDFTVVGGYFDSASGDKIKPIREELQCALTNVGMSKKDATKVIVSFTNI